MAQADRVCKALAILIASTKRVKRPVSLVEMVRHIATLKEALGGLRNVAEKAGLSPEMLRQFWTIRDLCPQVMALVAARKIDSVDVAHRIAKLAPSDQFPVAKAYIDEELSSDDVRAVVSYKRSHPGSSIERAVKAVARSRNVKQYVILLDVSAQQVSRADLRRHFEKAIGKGSLVSVSLQAAVARIVLNESGKDRLSQCAKSRGMTKRQFVRALIA